MVQRQKPEVREAIVKAAAEVFARDGFERATLSEVVLRAGTSIGNFYKYFANKEELFGEFIPRGFKAELLKSIRARVEAARCEPDVFALASDHRYRSASRELLSFTIEHRERVVFLLLRAQGSRHERFVDELVRSLVEMAIEHARVTFDDFTPTRAKRRALTRIYRAFVSTLGAIFVEEHGAEALREAVAVHARYHLTGLRAVFLHKSIVEERQ